jgi:predicted glycosyltransferase
MDDAKILIYAHDGLGVGHVSKMAKLAHLIYEYDKHIDIHFISGYNKVNNFLKENISYIKLPSYNRILLQEDNDRKLKEGNSNKIRKDILKAILLKTKFSCIIIDMFFWGTKNELKDILPKVKSKFPETKIILTLRGVIFSVERTKLFFNKSIGTKYLNRIFSKIICLCDERIIDVNKEYFDNKLTIPIRYLGYIYYLIAIPQMQETTSKNILINFGGGYKCDDILINLITYLNKKEEANINIHIILGEYLQQKTINDIFLSNYKFCIKKMLPHHELFDTRFDLIIGCGGYNVMMEAIFNNIPLIVIPKDNTDEAIIHASILENYSSIEILPLNQIDKIWDIINKQIISVPKHNLKAFTQSDIQELFI